MLPVFSEAKESSGKPPQAAREERPVAKPGLRKLTSDISGPSLRRVIEGIPAAEDSKTEAGEEDSSISAAVVPLTEERLREAWSRLTRTFDDRPNIKSALGRVPELGPGNALLLKTDNGIQEELVKNNKPVLLKWLRKELQNPGITLDTQVVRDTTLRRAYTDGEKFDEMAAKNEMLDLLKQRFMLDFDDLRLL